VKCKNCGSADFHIESTIIVTEFYNISPNGKVDKNPVKTVINNEDMAEYDNQIRCKSCGQAYVINGNGRDEIINKNYHSFDLNDDCVELSNY